MDFNDAYGVLQIMATPQPEEVDPPSDIPFFYSTYEKIKQSKEVLKFLWTELSCGSNKTTELLQSSKH